MVLTDAAVGVSISPFERLGRFVVALDVFADFAGEIGLGSKDATGNKVSLDFGEPDFDLIKPGGIGGSEVEADVGMGVQELAHGFGLMGREVVGDDVDLLAFGLGGHDLSQEGDKLCAGMTCRRLPQDLSAGNLQSRIEREGAVAEILKAMALGATGREGQDRIESIERLDRGLLIDTKDGGIGRRLEVEADDRGGFGFEVGIIAGHVMPAPGRLQSGLAPNPGDAHVSDAQSGPELARTPVRRAIGGLAMQSPVDDARLHPLGPRRAGLTPMTPPKPGEALRAEAFSPELDGIDAARGLAAHCHETLSSSQVQDNAGAADAIGPPIPASAHQGQFASFRRTQSKGGWHDCYHTCIPSDINVTLH